MKTTKKNKKDVHKEISKWDSNSWPYQKIQQWILPASLLVVFLCKITSAPYCTCQGTRDWCIPLWNERISRTISGFTNFIGVTWTRQLSDIVHLLELHKECWRADIWLLCINGAWAGGGESIKRGSQSGIEGWGFWYRLFVQLLVNTMLAANTCDIIFGTVRDSFIIMRTVPGNFSFMLLGL